MHVSKKSIAGIATLVVGAVYAVVRYRRGTDTDEADTQQAEYASPADD